MPDCNQNQMQKMGGGIERKEGRLGKKWEKLGWISRSLEIKFLKIKTMGKVPRSMGNIKSCHSFQIENWNTKIRLEISKLCA